MDKTIKYIYFEKHCHNKNIGGELKESIKNINCLLFKPETNSSGIWGFTTITDISYIKTHKAYLRIDQYWIDLEKYNIENNTKISKKDGMIINVINKVINKYRKEKIEMVLNL